MHDSRILIAVAVAFAACGGGGNLAVDGGSGRDGGPDTDGAPLADGGGTADAKPATDAGVCGTGGGKVVFAKAFAAATSSAVATDGAGNLAFTGSYAGTGNFGGSALPSVGGSTDIYVASLDATGSHRFSHSFGSASSNESGDSIAMDGSGNTIVVGRFDGSVDFGSGAVTGSQANGSVFVLKVDSAGNHVFDKHLDTKAFMFTRSVVAVDAAGDVYLSGPFSGAMTVDGTTLTAKPPTGANGTMSIYLLEWSPTGTLIFGKEYDGVGSSRPNSIMVAAGNVWLAGTLSGGLDFGAGMFFNSSSTGQPDMFVADLTASGGLVSASGLGGDDTHATGIGPAPSGGFFITGDYQNALGNIPPNNFGYDQIFLGRFDSSGNAVWAKGFMNGASDSVNALAADTAANVVIAGSLDGDTNFGCGNQFILGKTDGFVSKFDPNGKLMWRQELGSTTASSAVVSSNGVATDSTGVVAAGSFSNGTVSFGGTSLTAAAGSAFVVRFMP